MSGSNDSDGFDALPSRDHAVASASAVGRRPDDAVAFVESVEHATNEYVTEAIYEIFATDARQVIITDGALEESIGIDAIHEAWARTCAGFEATRFSVSKRLVAATGETIVNEWYGGPRGHRTGRGIEVWRFDHQSKVVEQRLFNYLKVRSVLHPLQVLQLLLSSRRVTVAVGWARLTRSFRIDALSLPSKLRYDHERRSRSCTQS
ncbi:nuclear transport factor 2 family protein [Nocardia sp. NPDC055029]